jgi:predicted enzyme related to lactoylglutathione lyase
MSERHGFDPGVPCWIDTWQDDPETAARFYAAVFGWEIEETTPPGSERRYFICRLRGRDVAAIGSPIPDAAPPTPVWTTYVRVDSADGTAAAAREAGGNILVEPADSMDGGRLAMVADPSGAVLGAWEQGGHRGTELVNELSAWSMSILHTRDPDVCKAFYGAVFGWETETFATGAGDAEVELYRRPGYVGGEPELPVPRDVVAVMVEMDSHGMPAELPPHWGVDFWIADVDEAAAKATELGGAVHVPPTDRPGFRQAALGDPLGRPLSSVSCGCLSSSAPRLRLRCARSL